VTSGALVGSPWEGSAAHWIRSEEELHALQISRRGAHADIHVTTTYGLRLGRHTDLVAGAVVSDRGPKSVTAVKKVIAWRR
jgi:hypothetical protein